MEQNSREQKQAVEGVFIQRRDALARGVRVMGGMAEEANVGHRRTILLPMVLFALRYNLMVVCVLPL